MKGRFFTLSIFFLVAPRLFSQGVPISPVLMGQGYHYVSYTMAATFPNTVQVFATSSSAQTQAWAAVTQSGCKLMRVGGKQFNIGNDNKPLVGQEVYYVSVVDDIRKHGCEPVLTLPFTHTTNINTSTPEPNYGSNEFSAAITESIKTATTILHLVNTVHKRNVKYVIIGNEYDVDYKWKVGAVYSGTLTLTAADIAANISGYILPIAEAVRKFDPSIRIIGPEGSYYDPRIYNLLFPTSNLNQTLSIAGTCTNVTGSPPVLDFMSTHLYLYEFGEKACNTCTWTNFGPNGGANNIQPTVTTNDWQYDQVYTEIEKYRSSFWDDLSQGARARGVMYLMKKKCMDISADPLRTQKPLGWMITELNSSHLNGAAAPNSDYDTRTHTGAMNLTRLYSLAMHYGASSIFMWSVKESDPESDRGYLIGSVQNVGDKRPSWYHYKMLADHFKGTYYRDEVLENKITGGDVAGVTQAGGPAWLHWNSSTNNTYTANIVPNLETKAFAAIGTSVAVMILNHSSNTQSVVVSFNGTSTPTTTLSNAKKFTFNAGKSSWPEIVLDGITVGSGANAPVDANSTHVIILNCDGSIAHRYRYTSTQATSSPPQDFDHFFPGSGAPSTFTAQIASSSTNNCLGVDNCSMTATPGYSNYAWKKLPNSGFVYTGSVNQRSPFTTGLYQVTATSGCGTVATTAVVHQNSPLVDGGSDLNTCVASTLTLGNPDLPLSANSYTWLGLTSSLLTGRTTTINSSNLTSRTVTMMVSDGGCTYSDLVNIAAPSNTNIIMMQDDPLDFGLTPNNAMNIFDSPDIWVSNGCTQNTNDGYINLIANSNVCINVRVRNLSCSVVNNVTVSLFHATGNPSNNWPARWGSPSPAS